MVKTNMSSNDPSLGPDPNSDLRKLSCRSETAVYTWDSSLRVSRVFFGVHVIKRRSYWPESDWPELFGMARTKDSAQRYQTILSAAILLAEVVG